MYRHRSNLALYLVSNVRDHHYYELSLNCNKWLTEFRLTGYKSPTDLLERCDAWLSTTTRRRGWTVTLPKKLGTETNHCCAQHRRMVLIARAFSDTPERSAIDILDYIRNVWKNTIGNWFHVLNASVNSNEYAENESKMIFFIFILI